VKPLNHLKTNLAGMFLLKVYAVLYGLEIEDGHHNSICVKMYRMFFSQKLQVWLNVNYTWIII